MTFRALVVGSVLVLAGPASAGLSDTFTPDERAVLEQLDQKKLIKARDLAEKVLQKHPQSFPATWAMAKVHVDEEGNHARALAWVRRAQSLLATPDVEWGRKLVMEEHIILAEMNRNEEALAVLDRFDDEFGPAPSYLRIWPLFKSGQPQRARELAMALLSSNDEWERAEGYNGLLSIDFEDRDREGAYQWSLKGVEATQGKNCTILRNAAASSYVRFRLDEALELSTRARKLKDCIDPVDNQLASLAVTTGQFQQAVSALESSRSTFIEKRYRPHFALERRGVLVDLLQAVGQPEEAVKLAAELYGQQQRMGVSSGAPEVERLSRTLRYAWALDVRVSQLGERAATGELPSGPASAATELARVAATRWEVRRSLVQLFAGGDRLELVVRPALSDPADWVGWRTGDLIEVVGTGVMRAAIASARIADAKFPEAQVMLDALEGEVAFREGHHAQAVQLAGRALEGLPAKQALLRWRVMGYRADSLRRLGKPKEARADLQEVLQRWPPAVRILRLTVPVTLSHDGSALAREAAARLARSPRLEVQAQAPFQVQVLGRGGSLDVCLLDDHGSQLACASGEGVTKALDAFHDAAFSAKVSLTQSDLKSLDGSPVRVNAGEAVKKLLTP